MAPSANVDLVLSTLDIGGYFQTVVSGSDITRGKPDPKIFSAAMRKLGVPPQRSIVIEDAVSGVQAGKAAGACTVAVTNSRSRHDLEQAGADLVVDTLTGIEPRRLASLLAARPLSPEQ